MSTTYVKSSHMSTMVLTEYNNYLPELRNPWHKIKYFFPIKPAESVGFHIQLTQEGSTGAEVSPVVSGYIRRRKPEKLEVRH